MKFLCKILLLSTFLSTFLSANEQNASLINALISQDINQSEATKAQDVYTLVAQILEDNVKIREYKLKNEGNESIYAREIATLQKDKSAFLSSLPSFIAQQTLDEKSVLQFLDKKKSLEKRLESLKNDDFEALSAKIELASMKSDELFYKTLFELENLFKQAANSTDIQELITPAMSALDANLDLSFEELKSRIEEGAKRESINKKYEDLSLKISTYNEILKYLKDNSALLQSNFVFSLLELQDYIDFINKSLNFKLSAHINIGKIAISCLVFVFFYLIRKALPHFVYFVLIKIIFRKKGTNSMSDKEIKDIFIEKSRASVQSFLFVYALGVCLSVIYYPSIVPLGISNAFYIIYAFLFTWIVLNVLDSYGVILISRIAQKSGKKEVANLIVKMLYFIIVIIAALFVLAHLGFNVSAIIASLGIGGLAVALAAKDIIANFFASVILAFDDSFNQGDWVEISGVEGIVVETGLRKTTIRTFDNSLVFFPNSVIMAANIKNWSKRRVGRRIIMKLGVGYDATASKLEQCVKDLKEYLATSPLVAHSEDSALASGGYREKYRQNLVSINDLEGYKSDIYVSLCEFADSSINIELYFYTKATGALAFREARQALMLDFMKIIAKNGLVFAYPSMSLYVENFKDLGSALKGTDSAPKKG